MMCQDEPLSMAFMCMTVLALLPDRTGTAAFCCGIGVVVAKVYLLIACFGVLFVARGRCWRE